MLRWYTGDELKKGKREKVRLESLGRYEGGAEFGIWPVEISATKKPLPCPLSTRPSGLGRASVIG